MQDVGNSGQWNSSRRIHRGTVFFAMIAKSIVHSENFNFRYACIFRYDSEFSHCNLIFLVFLVFHTSCMAI